MSFWLVQILSFEILNSYDFFCLVYIFKNKNERLKGITSIVLTLTEWIAKLIIRTKHMITLLTEQWGWTQLRLIIIRPGPDVETFVDSIPIMKLFSVDNHFKDQLAGSQFNLFCWELHTFLGQHVDLILKMLTSLIGHQFCRLYA